MGYVKNAAAPFLNDGLESRLRLARIGLEGFRKARPGNHKGSGFSPLLSDKKFLKIFLDIF